jgi:hypothetical protein
MPKAKEKTELTTIAINQERLKQVLERYYCKEGEKITWIGEKRSCDDDADFFAWDFEVQFHIEKDKEKKQEYYIQTFIKKGTYPVVKSDGKDDWKITKKNFKLKKATRFYRKMDENTTGQFVIYINGVTFLIDGDDFKQKVVKLE